MYPRQVMISDHLITPSDLPPPVSLKALIRHLRQPNGPPLRCVESSRRSAVEPNVETASFKHVSIHAVFSHARWISESRQLRKRTRLGAVRKPLLSRTISFDVRQISHLLDLLVCLPGLEMPWHDMAGGGFRRMLATALPTRDVPEDSATRTIRLRVAR
jgi:hypothetical protein